MTNNHMPLFPQSTGSTSSQNKFTQDPHWKLVKAPDPSILQTNAWHYNKKKTPEQYIKRGQKVVSWISATSSGLGLPGDYIYETKFDYEAAKDSVCSSSLTFGFATDDFLKSIKVNGQDVLVCEKNCESYIFQHKTVKALIKGSNVMQVLVHNKYETNGAPTTTGLFLQFDKVSTVCRKLTLLDNAQDFVISTPGKISVILISIVVFSILYILRSSKKVINSKINTVSTTPPQSKSTSSTKSATTVLTLKTTMYPPPSPISKSVSTIPSPHNMNTSNGNKTPVILSPKKGTITPVQPKETKPVNIRPIPPTSRSPRSSASVNNGKDQSSPTSNSQGMEKLKLQIDTSSSRTFTAPKTFAQPIEPPASPATLSIAPPSMFTAVSDFISNISPTSPINSTTSETSVNPTPYLDAFIRRLVKQGFKVERIKNGASKDQTLYLDKTGFLNWSESMFSKSQELSELVRVKEDKKHNGFVLEFKTAKRVLFRVKETEFPFNTDAMVVYFNAIIEKIKDDPTYVKKICSKVPSVEESYVDSNIDSGKLSDTGPMTPKASTTPRNAGNISGNSPLSNLLRRPSFSSGRRPSFSETTPNTTTEYDSESNTNTTLERRPSFFDKVRRMSFSGSNKTKDETLIENGVTTLERRPSFFDKLKGKK